jgi:hypothetical protein
VGTILAAGHGPFEVSWPDGYGVVVDGQVHQIPPDAALGAATVARDAVPHAVDAPELLSGKRPGKSC